jgi:iron(III) transport system ATP-binding protein
MLSIQGLNTHYVDGCGVRIHAVNDVSFDVPKGKLFTLLGPSGCGKTTTLRSIAGLEKPDAGTIKVDGTTVFSSSQQIFVPPNHREFGMVFQSYAIWPHMSVFRNASFPLEVGRRKWGRKKIEEKVMAALAAVGLDHLAERNATQLSGGQQQRLAVARALVMEPILLLLDEPLSNLDAKLRENMRFELKRLQRELKITTIYVTHDQEEALALSHEIAVMKDGQIVQKAAPREIYEHPNSKFVADFVGHTNFIDGIVIENNHATNRIIVDSEIGPISVTYRDDCSVASSVSLSVRPEHILISEQRPPGTNTNVFEGVVYSKLFLGEVLDFQIEVRGKILKARVHPSVTTPVGGKVYFTTDPERCVALEGKSQ